jgi:hypothetical protein
MRKIKTSVKPMTLLELKTFNNIRIQRESLERQLDNCNWIDDNLIILWDNANDEIERMEREYGIEYE